MSFQPFLTKKLGVPVPMQVLLVVIGIPISMALDLENQYGVAIVGNIPQGLPEPSAPDFHLFKFLIIDSFLIAFVGFGFTLSMAKLIAKRFNYSLNGNQELFAEVSVYHHFKLASTPSCQTLNPMTEFEQGMSNAFGGFFQCLPASASMSRSMAQATAGGTTQLTGLVSSAILVAVLASIGYILEPLPKVRSA